MDPAASAFSSERVLSLFPALPTLPSSSPGPGPWPQPPFSALHLPQPRALLSALQGVLVHPPWASPQTLSAAESQPLCHPQSACVLPGDPSPAPTPPSLKPGPHWPPAWGGGSTLTHHCLRLGLGLSLGSLESGGSWVEGPGGSRTPTPSRRWVWPGRMVSPLGNVVTGGWVLGQAVGLRAPARGCCLPGT